MGVGFESENFKELKQKEKTDLFFLLFFVIMAFVSFNFLTDIQGVKSKVIYANENIKAYETAIYGTEIANKKPVEELIQAVGAFKDSADTKLLQTDDLDNWKYIEFFINYHLAKAGQSEIKIGSPSANFVNWSNQVFVIPAISTNEKDISYLLTEFSNAGYLEGFELSKDGNLYSAKMKLHFKIN